MTPPKTLDELIAFVEKEFECRVGPQGPFGKWDECDPIKHPYYTLRRSAMLIQEEVEDCRLDLVRDFEQEAIQEIYRVFLKLIEVAPTPRRLIWRYPKKILAERTVLSDRQVVHLEIRTRIAVPRLDWVPLDLTTPEGMPAPRITLPQSSNANAG